jgi:hypothetical protein
MFRAIIVLAVAAVGFKIHNYRAFINLQGAFISTILYYALPSLFYLTTFPQTVLWKKLVLVTIVGSALIVGFMSGYEACLSLSQY